MMRVERKRAGRPPKIDRSAIAAAVVEVSPDELTMKRVAEHLGISLAGLYRYVNGRDELLRLAAEETMARLQTPKDRGQHWATWLREWGHYNYRLIRDHKELVEHLLDGSGPGSVRVLELLANAMTVLEQKGLDSASALSAFATVSATALGVALGDQEPVESDLRDWRSWDQPYFSQLSLEARAKLHELAETGDLRPAEPQLDECLTTVLIGVAVRAGLPLDDEVTNAKPKRGSGQRARPKARPKARAKSA